MKINLYSLLVASILLLIAKSMLVAPVVVDLDKSCDSDGGNCYYFNFSKYMEQCDERYGVEGWEISLVDIVGVNQSYYVPKGFEYENYSLQVCEKKGE